MGLSGKSILIVSYTHIADGEYTTLGGPALSIKEYLKARVHRLACFWQPVPISDDISAIAEVYENANPVKKWKFYVVNYPFGRKKVISFIYLALKLRDIICVFYFSFRLRWKFDIFLGVEALNAAMGVLLRRLGLVKRVIYYNLDYGKKRFGNPLLNGVFHGLDRFAVSHADYTWCLSEQMILGREERGITKERVSPQMVVPIGIYFNKIKRIALEKINRKSIVYLGMLAEMQGVQLAIQALPEIIKKEPQARLVIVGTGLFEGRLKEMVKELGLEDYVKFTGLVSDREVEDILCACAIGVAPYLDTPDSTKRFTDPTKPKMYVACGLPAIVTRVSPIAEDIEKARAGFAINYDKQELARAIEKLLSDDALYKEYRQNAINLALTYDWDNILDRAFTEVLKDG